MGAGFGNGLDHEIALAQAREVAVVVGGFDVLRPLPAGEWRWIEWRRV